MTSLSRLSKSSTLFLSEPAGAGSAALAADIGQRRLALKDEGTYVRESSSARTAIGAPREVSIVYYHDDADSGVLLRHGNAVTYGYQVSVAVGGVISVAEAGILRASITIANQGKVFLLWSQRVEGTTVIDELSTYFFPDAEWRFASGSHAASAVSATDTLTIGAGFGGASAYSVGITAFDAVRIGQRFVSRTEGAEDFVAETTPPAMTGRRRTPMLTGASDELLISNQGQFAGPTYAWALAATRQADSRTVTPLVNVVARSPYFESNAYAPVRYFKKAPDSTLLHMSQRYLFHVPRLDPRMTHARVRVHARIWNAASPGSVCSVYIRGYSMSNVIPDKKQMPAPLVYYRTSTAVITAQSVAGAWHDLSVVKLAREPSGRSYFALAHSFGLDAGGPLEGQTSLRIDAITVEPFHLPSPDDAFDLTT